MIRTYSELRRLDSFLERFKYLSLGGQVGASTFGFDRYLNQQFYRSREWKQIRDNIIVRDEGCDLGIQGYEINGQNLLIHHMNPISPEDLKHGNPDVFDERFLITTTHKTHLAIHYGAEHLLPHPYSPRTKGDTRLW